MISGATRGSGGPGLGNHLSADFAELGESRGLLATSIKDQVQELTKIAARAKHSAPLYHCFARPPEGAEWSQDDFKKFWDKFEKEFKLEKQPFSTAIHDGDGHQHRVYSLVKPNGACIRMDNDFARREKIGRIVEYERGDQLVKGAHNRVVIEFLKTEAPEVAEAMERNGLHDGPKPVAALTPQDRHQQERTKVQKADVARMTAEAWQSSDSPQAFMSALRESGLSLAKGDKATLVVDATGNTHSLARMLAMSARADGEPSPRAADIHARLVGVELPSLDEARQQVAPVPPVHDAAPIVAPDPVPPGGGQPVMAEIGNVTISQGAPSQDVTLSATPSNDGQPIPTAASAKPASGQKGGGGGSSPPSSDSQSSPLPSLDVGAGPGEPPSVNASPDEKAKFAAKLADYEDRKARAWLAWLKAWDSQNQKKGNPKTGGGSSDVHDEKGCREAATAILREISQAAERSAAIRAFNVAFEQFTTFRNDQNGPSKLGSERERAPRTNEDSSPSQQPGKGHASGHDEPQGIRGSITDAGVDKRRGDHGGSVVTDGEKSERNPLLARAESLAIGRFAALSDFSRLRAAMSDLNPAPDPLEGLGPKERKTRLQEFRQELLALYREDRQVLREHGQADWRERMAAEKVRSSPLAHELRTNWKHLTPSMREQGWKAIREARESLVEQMKATAKANPPDDFRAWLEFVSQSDPKALSVLTAMKEAEANKAKIQSELKLGDERLEALRSTAPKGERDENVAAESIKAQMKFEHASREADAQKARREAAEAASRVRWWMWKSHPTRAHARSLETAAQTIEHTAMIRAPSQSDFREAMETARSRARSNLRAFQAWEQSPKGKEASSLERSLSGIRTALAGKDFYMRDAILTGGIDGALEEQRRREMLEQRKRERDEKRQEQKATLERGHVVQFPSSGPRMR